MTQALVVVEERGEYINHHCWLTNFDDSLCDFETGNDEDGFAHIRLLRHIQTVHYKEYAEQPQECGGDCWHWYPDPTPAAIDFSGDV